MAKVKRKKPAKKGYSSLSSKIYDFGFSQGYVAGRIHTDPDCVGRDSKTFNKELYAALFLDIKNREN